MRFYLLIVLTFLVISAKGEEKYSKNNFWTYRYENDVFLGIDRYYTQGGRIEFSAGFLKQSPLNYLLPTWKNDSSRFLIFMEHRCYTPTSLLSSGVQRGDHPYAGVLLFGQERWSYSLSKHRILNSGLALGWMGRDTKCEEMQKSIHKATNNAEPQGWDNQLSSAFIINYNLGIEQGFINLRWMTFSIQMQVRVGTLFDDAQIGARMRLGKVARTYSVPDALGKGEMKWNLFFESNLAYVVYDATLQGGVWNSEDIHSVTGRGIEGLVFVGKAGVQLTIRALAFEYAQVYNTRRFSGGLDHKYGSALVRFYF